jgi:hypothetical protein
VPFFDISSTEDIRCEYPGNQKPILGGVQIEGTIDEERKEGNNRKKKYIYKQRKKKEETKTAPVLAHGIPHERPQMLNRL